MQLQCDNSDVAWHRVHNAESLPTADLLDWRMVTKLPIHRGHTTGVIQQGSYNRGHTTYTTTSPFNPKDNSPLNNESCSYLLVKRRYFAHMRDAAESAGRWLGSIAADLTPPRNNTQGYHDNQAYFLHKS